MSASAEERRDCAILTETRRAIDKVMHAEFGYDPSTRYAPDSGESIMRVIREDNSLVIHAMQQPTCYESSNFIFLRKTDGK